jgi:hypothetical protein
MQWQVHDVGGDHFEGRTEHSTFQLRSRTTKKSFFIFGGNSRNGICNDIVELTSSDTRMSAK